MEGRQLKGRVDILPPEGKEERVIMTSVILHPTKTSKYDRPTLLSIHDGRVMKNRLHLPT